MKACIPMDSHFQCKGLLEHFLRQGLTMWLWLPWNLLYRSGWPWTHRNPPASDPWVRWLKVCTTMPRCVKTFRIVFHLFLYLPNGVSTHPLKIIPWSCTISKTELQHPNTHEFIFLASGMSIMQKPLVQDLNQIRMRFISQGRKRKWSQSLPIVIKMSSTLWMKH